MPMSIDNPNFVDIGGGKGPSAVRRGMRKYPVVLTSIVPATDSGGSIGQIRRDYDVLSIGDLTQAWADHCKDPIDAAVHRHRFSKGDGLNGHRTANLLFVVEMEVIRDELLQEGIPEDEITNDHLLSATLAYHRQKYPIFGNVYPSTSEKNLDLVTILADQSRLEQEHLLDFREEGCQPIIGIELSREATVFPEAAKALQESDMVILGPSSLRGSIESNLAVKGLPEAMQGTVQTLVLNIANWKGETDGFKASDYARVITDRAGRPLDYLIYFQDDKTVLDPEVVKEYLRDRQEIIELDDVSPYVRNVRCFDLVTVATEMDNGREKRVFRHNPQKVADALMSLWTERQSKLILPARKAALTV